MREAAAGCPSFSIRSDGFRDINKSESSNRWPLSRGTESSNPSPSSGESGANLVYGGESHRWRQRQQSVSNRTHRQAGTRASAAAMLAGVDGTFASCTTAPFRLLRRRVHLPAAVRVSRSVEETRGPEMGELSPLPSMYDLVGDHPAEE